MESNQTFRIVAVDDMNEKAELLESPWRHCGSIGVAINVCGVHEQLTFLHLIRISTDFKVATPLV
jgi:hypothetical protein